MSKTNRNTRKTNPGRILTIRTTDGHAMNINADKIPAEKWTPFDGVSSDGVEQHCACAHIPAGTEMVIMSHTNGRKPAIAYTFGEAEMFMGRKRLNQLKKNAGIA